AIRIGKPARGEQALQAAEESKGRIIAASDDQILDMQKTLATLEGIWVEPASAAGLAGLAIEIGNGNLNPKGKRVAAICTGHALKAGEITTKDMQKRLVVPQKREALEEVILGENPLHHERHEADKSFFLCPSCLKGRRNHAHPHQSSRHICQSWARV